jgi:4-aminobutyrate aminotransferase-like enzyme
MDRAWPESTGEAIHTSTFLGHPVGCAMALAQVRELKEKKLITQARRRGKQLEKLCQRFPIRGARFVGKGLMAGLAFDESEGPRVFAVVKDMLRRGYILLPAGEHGNVIALTPAFTITEKQLERTLRALQSSFAKS